MVFFLHMRGHKTVKLHPIKENKTMITISINNLGAFPFYFPYKKYQKSLHGKRRVMSIWGRKKLVGAWHANVKYLVWKIEGTTAKYDAYDDKR
jgi:hypothetical protein